MKAILVDMRQEDVDTEKLFEEKTRCPVCNKLGRDHCKHLVMDHCDTTEIYRRGYKTLYAALEKAEYSTLIKSAVEAFVMIAESQPNLTVIRIIDELCGMHGIDVSYYIFVTPENKS